ncbi:hypothetical protein CF326_g900 [Tilletia indica]|nr:hypothetical protein CF326_g900 [Tilletia indica]
MNPAQPTYLHHHLCPKINHIHCSNPMDDPMDRFAQDEDELGAAVRRYAATAEELNVRPDWLPLIVRLLNKPSYFEKAEPHPAMDVGFHAGDLEGGMLPAEPVDTAGWDSSHQFECVLLPSTSRLSDSGLSTIGSNGALDAGSGSSSAPGPSSLQSIQPHPSGVSAEKQPTGKKAQASKKSADGSAFRNSSHKKGPCTECQKTWSGSGYWHHTVMGKTCGPLCRTCYQRAVRYVKRNKK